MKELSKKKYVTLITIMILVLGIIGIVNIGNIDLDKGKVKLKSASIEKLKSSVIESKGYEEITYPVLYELEKVEGIEERNVIIKGTLTKEENKYARFKEITSNNITSTVSENGREIEIKIEKVKLGRQNKINIKIEINGAINETKIKPEIEIKEESEKEYTKVKTEEIEVKTNSVTGLVQDEEGMSVSNLELSINKGNEEIRRTYTDENGRYVFSDVEEGKYIIKVEEENYELKEIKEVEVIGGITENIIVKKIKPYEIEVNKYISKIKLNNNGKEIEYEYGKLNKVNQTVKNLKNLSGEIEYKIEIKNTGEKSGEITKIEEEVTDGLKFSKEKNTEWEEKNGKIINRSLEGIKLKAGEEKEITLKLDIEKTDEARSYLQKVTAKGEVYQNVVYILGGKEYRKEKVLEGEKIEEPKIVQENFKGWYTDKKYTNKYNFENSVTKDIILYGKVEESTKKYTVQYIDEGKIIKEEELEEGSIINAPEVTKEGHTFIGWYEGEEKYDVYEPITRNLILESKYEINKYKVRFINEDGSILQEEILDYGSTPTYKKETPTKKRTEEYIYEFDKWTPEITKVTSNQEYKATYKETKNKYTVTYINDGEEYHKETALYGSVITEIQDPTKEGYTFTGWYTKDNEKITHPITVTKNITLYSKYEVNSYKVSYYNEGTKYIEDQQINYGENALKPNTDPSKIGYTFKYWSLKENGEEYEFSTKITKDIALYAVYEINKYTVTYINEGTEYHKETALYGSVITSIQDPIKEGYTFIGWYNENNEKVTHPITVTEDITLHSKYEINTYTVSFYHNNEKYVEDQKVNYGESAVKPSEDPTKEDYNFSGWVIKGTNNKYDFTSKVTKDIELESSFTAKPTYTVTFKIGNEVILTENVIEGHKVTSKEAPYKKGYLFDKWYSDEGLTIENNFDEKIMGNKTIYGKYNENKHTVTYINEGTTYYTEEVLDSFTAKGPSTNPEKDGYTFKYFSKDKKVAFDYSAEITEDITLYAVYEINTYTVTYINEGSEYHKEELTYGSKHEKIEDPFKTGYTFIGWYNENEEKVEYPITVTKDITLHSKYEINKYTVTYINEGVKYIEDQQINYKEKAVKPETNPSKIGYTFKYWSLKENGEEYNFNSEITENTTLYAVYNINKYTVTFKNYDGSTLQEETLEYGTLPKYKREAPTRETTKEYTYTFKGWDKEITEVTNNQEYIATYTETKNKYNVKFTNYDGSILQEDTLEYGALPVYKGEVPAREKTDEYTYTFKNWNKEITEVTDNEIYIATYTGTKNKYTVIYMDGEIEYTRKEVNYGETVSEEVINKDHNIYRGWTLEGNIYDFNTPVTNNITIKSSFELVESPIIESTPIEWTKENVKVTITTNHNDYSYMYKIDDGEYQNYNGEFTVDKNCTVIAKSIKENVESEVTTKEITNIDKVLPEIKEITEENITTKSFDIKVKGQDNESGLSEIRIYKNEELMVSYPYTERLNEEKEETYSLTGLEENTTYKIKVELIDKVGNKNVSEEKEITTLKRVIVSRIIGRNNSLYESEAEYELFESLEEAITACGSNECTIEMVLDTKESVNVLEGQEIKLELNGKTVTGVRDYTIENSGELIIVDKEETEGGIINNTDTAIKNIGNGILQIGENEEPLSVSMTKPNIVGTTYGIYTEEETSKLKFYDGKIEGNVAIQGNVDDTPYLYNAKITNEGHQVATLSILAEAEAKITGGKYYTKLSNAVSETKSGTYELKEQDIMSTVITPGLYGFDYDEETNSLISNNKGISSTAHSYIKLDLTNYTEDQELIVETFVSSITQAGWAPNNYGYVTINDNKNDPGVSQTSGRIICVNGEKKETGRILLEKGKVYYIHLGYTRPSSYTISGDDSFKITKIMLSNYEIDKFIDLSENVVTTGEYGFIYSDGVLKSNNQGKLYTTANSYIKVDLTDYAVDQKIYISAEISSWYGSDSDPGYVIINDSEENPSYNDTNGRVIYISRNESVKDVAATLPAGKVSYIHFGYKKGSAGNYGTDTFTISSITYNKCTPVSNVTEPVPILNDKVDTVELIKDITLTSPIEINETKEMVLDLKGYTLTTSSNDYVIKNSGDLTIIDSKYSNEQDKNQTDYEAEQAKYDEEYNQELDFKNKKDKEYEKNLEDYNKKLEEYNKAHPDVAYDYTGNVQEYVVPVTGSYQIELWGAQGGPSDANPGGKGAYTKGIISLTEGTKLYIYVGNTGNKPDNKENPFNGGGKPDTKGSFSGSYNGDYSGGGATDVRILNGAWDDLASLSSRIMVAAGGGGGNNGDGSSGGPGGTLNGETTVDLNSGRNVTVPTQTTGYEFGRGQGSGTYPSDGGADTGAGGGGYYGGYRGLSTNSGGSGGSSYISGYLGSIAIKGESDISPKEGCSNGTNDIECSYHYSGLIFTDSEMIAGNGEMPTYDESGVMTGNSGNGYAKITKVDSETSSKAKKFYYTGKEETYAVPEDGTYKLETWGAQGGSYNETYHGGYGGYSSGYITLKKGDKLYINVGGQGKLFSTSEYNGGGSAAPSESGVVSYSGGGATHISTKSGLLSTLSSNLDTILVVSGGGGGTSYENGPYTGIGGSGGGYVGNNGTNTKSNWLYGQGGNQTSGGADGGGELVNNEKRGNSGVFGQGGNGIHYSGGGGGGYYGGGASNQAGAGGGSGYIGNSNLTNKSMYCYSCQESTDESTKTISTTNVSETPTENYAKIGNGYAKITKIDNTSTSDDTTTVVTKPEKPLKPVNGYTIDDYVKDDIKLQLDGIDITNESKWSNLSDNSNNGTINGATKQDTGYYFDGSNDYVSFKQMNYDNVTVEATITPQISDSGERDIIANYEGGGYGLHIKNGYINAEFYINGSYRAIQSLDKYEIGKTYVVQATYDGEEMKLYVNNKLQNTVSVTGTIGVPTNNTIVMLGSNPRGTSADGNYFKGIIYSARIYDRVLNADELYKNYNSDEKRFIGIIRKEATLKEAILTGTITSTTNSVIYNSLGANLTIRDGNIVLNKSGEYNAITNEGTVSLLENGVLNTKQANNRGIYNGYNANIKDGGGTINQNSSGYGILSVSKVEDGFSNITFNLNSGYGFYSSNGHLTLNNIKIINGNAYNIEDNVEISFNNSIINSKLNSYKIGIIEFNNVIHNISSSEYLYGNVTINNSEFNTSYIYSDSKSKVRINNSTINSAEISNFNNMEIIDSTINASGISVYNNIEITNSSLSLNGYEHYGNPVISGTNVIIKGNSNIVGESWTYRNSARLIDATNLTIGENNGEITEYPFIKNTRNAYGLKATNLYIYDGSITTYKNKAVMSSITEIEENSKINITTDGDNETLSLVKAEDAVAQIGNETYTSLKSAVDAVKTGETIKILSDIYPINTFKLTNNNFTIDLNSNKVRSFSSDSLFNNAGELNVIDDSENAIGSINSVSSTIFKNIGTLNVKNIGVNSINTINNTGTLNINNSKISSSDGYLVTNNEESNMTIESTTLNGGITNNGDMNINSSNVQSGSITNNNKLTTNNNTISVVVTNNAEKVFDSTSDTYNEVINNYGNYTVSETTINQTLNNYGSGIFNIKSGITKLFIYNRDTSTLNISGGTIGYGIENIGTGTVNMTGGNIDTSRNGITNNNGGIINIGVKDGTVNKESPIIKSSSDNGIYNGNGTLNFYDGTIKGKTAISGTINDIEENYDIIKQTENGLEVKYLGREYAAQIESTGEKYYTLKEAIDAVTNASETVKLLRDITSLPTAETITITDDKNIILDLNGNVISQGNTPLIVNNGTLDLKDTAETKGGLVSTAGTIIENTGTLTMDVGSVTAPVKVTNLLNNSGTLIINNISMSVAGGSSNLIINTGNTTINKGSFYSDSINPAIYNKSDGTLTINDATITSNSYNRVITNEGTAYIYAKTITMNSYFAYTDAVYIYNATNANLTIDGFTGVQGRGGTVLQNDGTANILNSSFGTYAYIYNYSGTLNLTNDNFDSNFGNNSGTLNIYSGKYNQSIYTGSGTMFNIYDGVFNGRVSNDGGTLNIKGGTFNSGVQNTGTLNIGVKDGEVSTEIPYITGSTYGLEINGGTVNFYDGIISGTTDATKGTINDIEEGYEIISGTTEDGKKSKYLSRSQLAEIESTGEKYYTLQEAIDAVTVKDETIKMLRNYTTLNILDTITVAEDKSIILDLNGYKLEQNNEKFLINNGTLTITDSSENSTNKIEMYADKLIENNGTLILDSLNIDIKSTITNVINNKSTLKLVDSSVLNVSNRGGHSLFVENSGTLTLENTTMDFNYYDSDTTVNNTGTLNVIGGNYKIFGGKLFKNSSIVNVKGGTYTFTYWYESYYSAWLLYSTSNEDMTIDSINVISQNNGTKATSIYNSGASNTVNVINSNDQAGTNNASTGTMIITGGTLAGVNNSGMMTVSNSSIGGISNGSRVLDIKESTLSSISNYNGGTINVYDSNVSNNIGNSSIVNFYSGSVASSSIGVSNSGTFNLISGTITSTSNNAISNSGTINIGTKDGNVSTEMPVITGKTYGVSNGGSGKVNFYDGIVSGETGAFYGTVNEVEPGYKIVTNKTDTLTSATLTLVGDDEKVAVLNGINFTSLQDAINSASDTNESIITLYKDVTFESNITVPANKNIKLYLNGYILNKGSNDFTGEGKITVIDGTSTNALANIMESVKEVLNIEGIKKNIIIYEMDDGSAISSESTYKLYKDNEEVILEEDAIGIYSVGNSNDEIRSANNKIYINELPKGKYKLIGDNNKEVKFEIDESGKIIGKVKENTKETRKLVSTAVAELIIMIQTGIEKVNYIMIILTLLVTISSLLYIVKKVNVKES